MSSANVVTFTCDRCKATGTGTVTIELAHMIAGGGRVTVPEGWRKIELPKRLRPRLPDLDLPEAIEVMPYDLCPSCLENLIAWTDNRAF